MAVRGYPFDDQLKVCRLPRVKWLLDHGADREIKDEQGKSPVDYVEDQEMRDLFKGSLL